MEHLKKKKMESIQYSQMLCDTAAGVTYRRFQPAIKQENDGVVFNVLKINSEVKLL